MFFFSKITKVATTPFFWFWGNGTHPTWPLFYSDWLLCPAKISVACSWVCVCVCVRETERESVSCLDTYSVQDGEPESVWDKVREREREKCDGKIGWLLHLLLSTTVFVRECARERERAWERDRERKSERERETERKKERKREKDINREGKRVRERRERENAKVANKNKLEQARNSILLVAGGARWALSIHC